MSQRQEWRETAAYKKKKEVLEELTGVWFDWALYVSQI